MKASAWLVLALFLIAMCPGCYPKRVGPPGANGKLLTWPEMSFEQRKAHMEKEVLPRLSGDFLLGPEFQKHPQTTQLKLNQLVPEMADALGLKSFSLVTLRGVGCYSCHLGPDGPLFGN